MREIEVLKKPFFWLFLFLALVFGALWQWPDNRLHLVFCDVGQGDAALIIHQNKQILIDGGPDSSVLNCLGRHLPFWDRKIEMIVLTHPDSDHLSGLIDVIDRYNVTYMVLNSAGKDSPAFAAFQQAVEKEGAVVHFPRKGDRLQVGPVGIEVLWPFSQERVLGATTAQDKTNETSTVFRLEFGDFDGLFTGDISQEVESRLDLAEVELLKVAHHGSKYSTGEDFLEKISPELAVISVGKNSFGHPTEEVLSLLAGYQIQTLRTDQMGDIEIVSDGKSYAVKTYSLNI